MAQLLQDYEFKGPGGRPKYPWSTWFDGRTWELRAGEDFDRPLHSFRRHIYAQAARQGIKVRINIVGGNLRIRAVTE